MQNNSCSRGSRFLRVAASSNMLLNRNARNAAFDRFSDNPAAVFSAVFGGAERPLALRYAHKTTSTFLICANLQPSCYGAG